MEDDRLQFLVDHIKHVSELKTERDLNPALNVPEPEILPRGENGSDTGLRPTLIPPSSVITDFTSLFGAPTVSPLFVNPAELFATPTNNPPHPVRSLTQPINSIPMSPPTSSFASSTSGTLGVQSTLPPTRLPPPGQTLPPPDQTVHPQSFFSLPTFSLSGGRAQAQPVQLPTHLAPLVVQVAIESPASSPSPNLIQNLASSNSKMTFVKLPGNPNGSPTMINMISLPQFSLPSQTRAPVSTQTPAKTQTLAPDPYAKVPADNFESSVSGIFDSENEHGSGTMIIPPLQPQPRNVKAPTVVKSAHPFLYVSHESPNGGKLVTGIEQLKPNIMVYTPSNAFSNTLNGIVDQSWKIADIARHLSLDGWRPMLNKCTNDKVFPAIDSYLEKQESEYGPYCPLKKDIFKAFELCPLSQVEVVIVGQDPYYTLDNDGLPTAQGFSFSARRHSKIPKSLVNIFKEIKRSLPNEITSLANADLSGWAAQGVLMLNTCLTVRTGGPSASHKSIWISFINEVISAISAVNESCIYVLWGRKAEQSVGKMLSSKNIILTSSHPSPLSARYGFDGCGHFAEINEILREQGKPGIDWNVH